MCELISVGSEEAVFSYGCSYLLGVILVVFFAQSFSGRSIKHKTLTPSAQNLKSKTYFELLLIGISALLGNILGSVKIASINISIGTTASTLLIGLFIGYIVNKNPKSKSMSNQCLNAFKNLGLALFFTGTGFSTGFQTVTLDIKTVLYGALITLSAIFCGFLLCKLVERKYGLHNGFIVSGGMTSSPAYGAIASEAIESYINGYSFAYFGALLSLLSSIQFICR